MQTARISGRRAKRGGSGKAFRIPGVFRGRTIRWEGNPARVCHGTRDRDGLLILTGSKAVRRPASEEDLHAFTGMDAASINFCTIRDSFENDNLLDDPFPDGIVRASGRR